MNGRAHVRPAAFSVFCNYSMHDLEQAHTHIHGRSFSEPVKEFVDLGEFGDDEVDSDLDLSDPKTQAHLDIFFSMQHEQYHLKHLSGSPYGFFQWALHSARTASCEILLRSWSSSMPSAMPFTIPLIESRPRNRALNELKKVWEAHEGMRLLMGFGSEAVGAPLFGVVGTAVGFFLEESLGLSDKYPEVGPRFARGDYPRELDGKFDDDAVIEGLARCNEYFLFALMFGSKNFAQLNRFALARSHGVYQAAVDMVSRVFGTRATAIYPATALLADWALQAPSLPFLLRGRSSVALEELRPASRFLLLLEKCRNMFNSVNDLVRAGRECESSLFGELNWESPSNVAQRISDISDVSPDSPIAALAWKNLCLAAKLRSSELPSLLRSPLMTGKVNSLLVGLGFFEDGRAMQIGVIPTDDDKYKRLLFTLVDNAFRISLVDALCSTGDLNQVKHMCRCLKGTLNVEPESLFRAYIERVAGPRLAGHKSARF